MAYKYPSVLCEHCPYTEHGTQASGMHTPNGYNSCEGRFCEEALTYYKEETGDEESTVEDLF